MSRQPDFAKPKNAKAKKNAKEILFDCKGPICTGDKFTFENKPNDTYEMTGKMVAINHPLVEDGNAIVLFFKKVK
jgi:hypothetical protein